MSDDGQSITQMWKPGEGWLVAVLVMVLLIAAGISVSSNGSEPMDYRLDYVDGSMFISDAGATHGGFEFTASYKVRLSPVLGTPVYTGDEVYVRLELEVGLGDPLSVHELLMRVIYAPESDEIHLTIAKTRFQLVHVLEDTVWDHEFDGYYIASWGGSAPPEEIRGNIGPRAFGLPDHYYVELRLDMTVLVIS